MFKDQHGYLCAESLDGGDSAVREGLAAIFGQPNKILDFVNDQGLCVRNPAQKPWDNPNNFTKDQLKLLVAGLYSIGRQDLCLKIYEAHKARGFCQSSERDWPGSTKLMRPHAFYKDSVPSALTVPMDFSFRKFRFEPDLTKLDPQFIIETKLFDHADILLPNDWEFLKVAAGIKQPGGLGLWWHHQALRAHANSSHNEENQMFAECVVLGTLKDYVRVNPKYGIRSLKYWFERNEFSYHIQTMEYIKARAA